MPALFTVLATASAATGQDAHVAVVAGGGVAYGGTIGGHVELILSHVAIYGGIGVDTRAPSFGDGLPAYAAGMRLFMGANDGAMLSLNFAYLGKHLDVAPAVPVNEYTNLENVYLGATVGWRERIAGRLFIEGGLGAAWLRQRSRSTADPPFGTGNCNGTAWPRVCDNRRVVPDLDIAGGFSF